eukprot:Nk52_evm12s279 gene=Nk52_evmTU12s279
MNTGTGAASDPKSTPVAEGSGGNKRKAVFDRSQYDLLPDLLLLLHTINNAGKAQDVNQLMANLKSKFEFLKKNTSELPGIANSLSGQEETLSGLRSQVEQKRTQLESLKADIEKLSAAPSR